MAWVLVGIGGFLLYLEYLGTDNVIAAGSLLKNEVFGGVSSLGGNNDPYWKWLGALIVIGALGYVDGMEDMAFAFLVLILLGIVLSHSSAFSTLIKGL